MPNNERPRITREAIEQVSNQIKAWENDKNTFEQIPPAALKGAMVTVSDVIREAGKEEAIKEIVKLDPKKTMEGMNAIADIIKSSEVEFARIEKDKIHSAINTAAKVVDSKAVQILKRRLAEQNPQQGRG